MLTYHPPYAANVQASSIGPGSRPAATMGHANVHFIRGPEPAGSDPKLRAWPALAAGSRVPARSITVARTNICLSPLTSFTYVLHAILMGNGPSISLIKRFKLFF